MTRLNTKKYPFFLLAFFLAFWFHLQEAVPKLTCDVPTSNGPFLRERIEFNVKWWFVSLVSTYMETYELNNPQEPIFYLLTHQAAPNTFWNDRMESVVDSRSLLPCQMETIVKDEGRQRKNSIIFDREMSQAKLLLEDKESGDQIVSRISIGPKSMDPLSAFYYLRKRLSPKNRHLELRGITGSRRFTLEGKLVTEEDVRVPAGNFKVYRLECVLTYRGRPTGSGENGVRAGGEKRNPFTLWVTRDEHRFPVQIRYRLSLGSLWVRAISVESHDLTL